MESGEDGLEEKWNLESFLVWCLSTLPHAVSALSAAALTLARARRSAFSSSFNYELGGCLAKFHRVQRAAAARRLRGQLSRHPILNSPDLILASFRPLPDKPSISFFYPLFRGMNHFPAAQRLSYYSFLPPRLSEAVRAARAVTRAEKPWPGKNGRSRRDRRIR